MTRRRTLPVWSLAVALAACTPPFDAGAVEREAERFMAEYAHELISHDRERIANRYDRRGAHLLIDGRNTFRPFASVQAAYGDTWQGPAAFQWDDITLEVLSPDAVMVVTRFLWTPADTLPPLSFSHAALLMRQDGVLRIRIENEVVNTAQDHDVIPAADSVDQ